MITKLMGLANPFRAARFAKTYLGDMQRVSQENNISLLRLMQEQIGLYLTSEIRPNEYLRYRLYRHELSYEDKKSYIANTHTLRHIWKLAVDPKYTYLFKNKLIFHRYFHSMGFPLAKLLGVYDPLCGATVDGMPLRNATDLANWMETTNIQQPVFKPIESAQGQMILIFVGRKAGDASRFVTMDGKEYNAQDLAVFMGDLRLLRRAYPRPEKVNHAFLIEERIRSHPDLVELASTTLCCIRVNTMIGLDGRPKILTAVIKLQPDPIGLDHAGRGSIIAWVDPESGVLGEGRKLREVETIQYRVMPSTGIPITGFQIPYWSEARDMVLRAAMAFPWARAIGWDVGITEKGPVLIEGNEGWSAALPQLVSPKGLLSGEFKELYEALKKEE